MGWFGCNKRIKAALYRVLAKVYRTKIETLETARGRPRHLAIQLYSRSLRAVSLKPTIRILMLGRETGKLLCQMIET